LEQTITLQHFAACAGVASIAALPMTPATTAATTTSPRIHERMFMSHLRGDFLQEARLRVNGLDAGAARVYSVDAHPVASDLASRGRSNQEEVSMKRMFVGLKVSLCLALAAVALMGTLAYAGKKPPPPPPPGGGGCPRDFYCLDVWQPVTCADGITYSNQCYADRACAPGPCVSGNPAS